jgi:hypothetical protein
MTQLQRFKLKFAKEGTLMAKDYAGDFVLYEDIKPLLDKEREMDKLLALVGSLPKAKGKFGGPKDLVGKTVLSLETVSNGYNNMQCIVCTDGNRVLLRDGRECTAGSISSYLTAEYMKKAPLFFTKEEISKEEDRIAAEKKAREDRVIQDKIHTLKKLQKELSGVLPNGE